MSGVVADTSRSSADAESVRLALIVPLALERQCLTSAAAERSDSQLMILQSGQGADNAARIARLAIANGAQALLSIGVAGALSQELAAGDVVVPTAVIDAQTATKIDCSHGWSEALRRKVSESGTAHGGTLLSVTGVLASAAQKAAAAQRFGSVACDMESAAIAATAQEAKLQFAVLRVISDAAADELPSDVSNWVDSSGNPRMRPVLGAMLSPGRWRSVISMALNFRIARRRLRHLSEHLSAMDYCLC
jgi:adenosylhomocysteine nucleosidase